MLTRHLTYGVVTLLWALASVPGCGGEGRADEDLGGLVHSKKEKPAPIDVDKAARKVAELGRAISMPHHRVSELLGAHRFEGTSSIKVTEGGKLVESYTDETLIALDTKGNYHAKLDNSAEYGREVFFVEGTMYLRPRFGKYHRRAPADDSEPERVRDEIYGALAACWELLFTRAELTPRGPAEVGGRAGQKVEIAAAPKAKKRPTERYAHRKWRESIEVKSVSGEVILDAESGVPLQAKLSGEVSFRRDGRTFEMALEVTHRIGHVAKVLGIAAPPAEQTVETHKRRYELEERDRLLRGIAPPARRAGVPPAGTSK